MWFLNINAKMAISNGLNHTGSLHITHVFYLKGIAAVKFCLWGHVTYDWNVHESVTEHQYSSEITNISF